MEPFEEPQAAESLTDAYGRTVTDLRVSVTKRCNFRCVYCHDEGLGPVLAPRAPHADEMSADEIELRVKIAREFSIRSVKLTGGEPLLRADLCEVVERVVRHIPDVSIATNGSRLARMAGPLRTAGLKRVNVSVDALDPEAFREIRRGDLTEVLAGIHTALAAGLKPLKLNLVVFKKTLTHIPALIDFAKRREGLRLQLIQFMPELVGHADWTADIEEVKRDLEEQADRVLTRDMHHRRIYLLGGAEVEVVDPVFNAEFCAHCRRLRLTHDAKLKGCLNRDDDLIDTRGMDPDGLRGAFRRVTARRVPYYGVHVKDFVKRDPIPAARTPEPGTRTPVTL